MADLKSPVKVTIKGEVTSITRPLPSPSKEGSFYRIVTIEDWNTGGVYNRPISDKLFEGGSKGSGLKSVLQEGKFVELTLDQLIDGETEYKDTKGTVHTHVVAKGKTEVISGATAISAAKYQMIFKAGLMQAQA